MNWNTWKTSFGFLSTMLRKIGLLKNESQTLEGIYNYLPITEQLRTSGQPSEAEFNLIRDAGFTTVVNLAPHQAENSLPDEAGTLKALGIEYVHIPVDFKNPTDENFASFTEVLQRTDTPLWVHCAANMRVSAFVYRYRRDVLQLPDADIRPDLEKIWEPFGVWQKFLKNKG